VRLLESNGHSGRYACLSHCWGKAPTITTTARTLDDHKKAIPVAALSKTFQDAIAFTRRLGLRYLWIDTL
jgi:hypothetical protein